MRFFFDNCVNHKIVKAMREMGESRVVHLRDEGFAENTLDVDWLPAIASKGLILVTGDKKILSRAHELAALREHKTTAFFLHKGFMHLGRWEQASWLFAAWPDILSAAERAQPGQCFDVAQNRKVAEFTPKR